MGNYLSNNTLLLSAKRALGRYNIESRTFKEIEKQSRKPVVAPKHEAGIIDYHKSLSGKWWLQHSWANASYEIEIDILLRYCSSTENTEYLTETTSVNKELDERLKGVYVTSQGLASVWNDQFSYFVWWKWHCIGWHLFIYFIFSHRPKIWKRQKRCHNSEPLRRLSWATKMRLMCHRVEWAYCKRSILLANINRIPKNGPLKKLPKKIKSNPMSHVRILWHLHNISFEIDCVFFFFVRKIGDIVNFYRVFDVHISGDMNPREREKIRSDIKLLGAKTNSD